MSTKWKFKKYVEPQGSNNGFWYDISDGGYIRPDELLDDPKQNKKVAEAIDLLISFKEALTDNELIIEY